MTLDLQADSAIFVADFGETIRIRTDSTARARTVTAVVNRNPVADSVEAPFAGRRPPLMHVLLRNSSTHGAQPSEINEDTFEIEADYPQGADPRWRSGIKILRHNAGTVLLEVAS